SSTPKREVAAAITASAPPASATLSPLATAVPPAAATSPATASASAPSTSLTTTAAPSAAAASAYARPRPRPGSVTTTTPPSNVPTARSGSVVVSRVVEPVVEVGRLVTQPGRAADAGVRVEVADRGADGDVVAGLVEGLARRPVGRPLEQPHRDLRAGGQLG